MALEVRKGEKEDLGDTGRLIQEASCVLSGIIFGVLACQVCCRYHQRRNSDHRMILTSRSDFDSKLAFVQKEPGVAFCHPVSGGQH